MVPPYLWLTYRESFHAAESVWHDAQNEGSEEEADHVRRAVDVSQERVRAGQPEDRWHRWRHDGRVKDLKGLCD